MTTGFGAIRTFLFTRTELLLRIVDSVWRGDIVIVIQPTERRPSWTKLVLFYITVGGAWLQ